MSLGRTSLIRAAADRRRPLLARGTNAYRVLNGAADGTPDVAADVFDRVVVASFYRALPSDEERSWAEALAEALSAEAVYLKRRPKEARVEATTRKDSLAPALPAWGAAVEARVVRESGLRFQVRPGQGLSVGLYLDARDARAWVRSAARGRSVANLFAYTCGFGVAARAGGASRAVNVDLSRRVLDWGAENERLNGQEPSPDDHVASDANAWLRRAARRGEQYGLVVLDPPSFSTSRKATFSAEKDYPGLARAAAALVEPRGLLVACCNLAKLDARAFGHKVDSGLAAAGRNRRLVDQFGASPVDFPTEIPAQSALKVLIYELA